MQPNVGLLLKAFTGPLTLVGSGCSSKLQTGCDLRTAAYHTVAATVRTVLPPPLPFLAPPSVSLPPPQLHAAVPWRTPPALSLHLPQTHLRPHSRFNQIRDVDSYHSPRLSESLWYPYLFSSLTVYQRNPDFLAAFISALSDTQNELIVIGKFVF